MTDQTIPEHLTDLCENDREALLALVDAALNQGYALAANTEDDDESWTEPTRDRATILAALGVCDEELLCVLENAPTNPGALRQVGTVSLIYDWSNCEGELFQDYHVSLEPLIEPICERLERDA